MCLVGVFFEQYETNEIIFRQFVQMTQPLGCIELFQVEGYGQSIRPRRRESNWGLAPGV